MLSLQQRASQAKTGCKLAHALLALLPPACLCLVRNGRSTMKRLGLLFTYADNAGLSG
jgi:hypothetical protein